MPALCLWRLHGALQLAWRTILRDQAQHSRLRSHFRSCLFAILCAVHNFRRYDAGDDVSWIAGGELLRRASDAATIPVAQPWIRVVSGGCFRGFRVVVVG